MQEIWVQSLGWEDPLEKETTTHSSIYVWKIPKSLAGYSPWGSRQLDTAERLHFHFSVSTDPKPLYENPYLILIKPSSHPVLKDLP